MWALGIATILGGAAWIGLLRSTLGQSSAALGSSGLLGLAFLAAGLVDGRVGALRKDSDAHSLEGNSALALVKYTQYAINLEANTDQLF